MNKRTIPILVLTFVNVLGFAIVIPVLPFVVEDFGGGTITYGILLSMYPMFQFLGAPILGSLSDRFGRRPILLISQAGTLIAWIIFSAAYFAPKLVIGPFALPLYILALARIVDGITGGNFSVANAYIADITPREKRTSVYGALGAAVGIGLIVGPVAGGLLLATALGFLGVGLASAAISTVTLFLMYRFLPESLDNKSRNTNATFHILREINVFGKIGRYSNPAIRKLFFMRAFFALTFSSYTSTIVLFMKEILSLSSEHIGLLFLVLGSFFIFNQSVTSPYLARKYGDLNTFLIGQVLMLVGLSLMVFVPNTALFILVAYFINLGFSSSFPTFKSLITGLVDKSRQGEITGLDESILSGASAVAPLAASFAFAYMNAYSYALFGLMAAVPYGIFWLRGSGIRPQIESSQ